MTASLTPEHLGAGTTINVGFQITAPHGAIPPPLAPWTSSTPRTST